MDASPGGLSIQAAAHEPQVNVAAFGLHVHGAGDVAYLNVATRRVPSQFTVQVADDQVSSVRREIQVVVLRCRDLEMD